MNIQTNLSGRLRNTALPTNNGLLPMYEAVSNAIHAIEDAGPEMNDGRIVIEIDRDNQADFSYTEASPENAGDTRSDIIGFKISDNGVGFNEENMNSFLTLDSDYKAARGGRGVGRLLWLKAFDRVQVESTFKSENAGTSFRTFSFDSRRGVFDLSIDISENKEHGTIVKLVSFEKKYQEAAPKTAKVIARNLLEHCLWYFVRPGGAPRITVVDGEERIDLDRVYEEQMVSAALSESIELKGHTFDLIHVKISSTSSRGHCIAYCAANRLVTHESLKGKIPGLFGALNDDGATFVYECYVSSRVLDERVRSERTGFNIENEPLELLTSVELSQREISDAIISRAKLFLSDYLEENLRLGRERVSQFANEKAPRYRPILSRIPKEHLLVDPGISDKELDMHLHKHLAELERKLLSEGHDLLQPHSHENFPDYHERVSDYLRTAEDMKRSDLANYVSHRRVIIDLLESAIQRRDGKYAREELIHSLIMPMRVDSTEILFESCNLWLIDERLAFHNYLASDKTLRAMPITSAADTTEPDIVALNFFDNPLLVSEGPLLPPAALVVIEIKRPMRNDISSGEEKNPIEQALGYLNRIRHGGVMTASGRLIPSSENTPGFCYVICDLTDSVVDRCAIHDAIRTSDGLGYFFYHKTFKAYVEVISFDRLVNMAKERNRAFFDKLGFPTA